MSLSVTAWSCAVVVAQCSVLRRNCSAHQVLVVVLFPCDSSSCTHDCWRHGARNGSRNLMWVSRRVFSSGLKAWKQLCRVFEPVFRRDFSGSSRHHCRPREQTVRCQKFDGYQVPERQRTSSWRCCKVTCATESPLANLACSQEA